MSRYENNRTDIGVAASVATNTVHTISLTIEPLSNVGTDDLVVLIVNGKSQTMNYYQAQRKGLIVDTLSLSSY